MIGANNTITKHVFPYYININNKLHRLNETKISKDINIHDTTLKEINNIISKNVDLSKYNITKEIHEILTEYTKYIQLF
jgi:hypothetical protein